jgi:hypothetical protein
MGEGNRCEKVGYQIDYERAENIVRSTELRNLILHAKLTEINRRIIKAKVASQASRELKVLIRRLK